MLPQTLEVTQVWHFKDHSRITDLDLLTVLLFNFSLRAECHVQCYLTEVLIYNTMQYAVYQLEKRHV